MQVRLSSFFLPLPRPLLGRPRSARSTWVHLQIYVNVLRFCDRGLEFARRTHFVSTVAAAVYSTQPDATSDGLGGVVLAAGPCATQRGSDCGAKRAARDLLSEPRLKYFIIFFIFVVFALYGWQRALGSRLETQLRQQQ